MARSIASLHERITRSLRFRLTLTYLVFFTIFLIFLGVFFRATLRSLHDSQLRNILNEEWAAVRGYLRIEKGKIKWFYDREDPEEAIIVDRLRQIYLLTDQNGTVLQSLHQVRTVRHLRVHREIRETLRTQRPDLENQNGFRQGELPYSRGLLIGEDDKPYFVAIGRSYAEGDRSSSSSRAITRSCCR